jgi:hypothetical protein
VCTLESYVTTDGQSASLSWNKAPICGLRPDFFITIWQLRVCWYGALSLTRGRVCRLQLLLALASAIILGSESRGTRIHVLLYQIPNFHFHRLLRLAGLRWRCCESYVITDSQPARIKHTSGAYDQIFISQSAAGLLMWGVLSDERTGLSFTIAAGPRQRSHFLVRVQWDSWPYFTLSDSRLSFSSPPTTRRATVEVFWSFLTSPHSSGITK